MAKEIGSAGKHHFLEIGLKPFRVRASGWGLVVVLALAAMFFAGLALELWDVFPLSG